MPLLQVQTINIMALYTIFFTTSIDRNREVQPFKVKSLVLCGQYKTQIILIHFPKSCIGTSWLGTATVYKFD